MTNLACVLLAFLVVSFAPVYSLKCNEGFNASVVGIPLFHWVERECSENSECFTQELGTKMLETELEVVMRYGGCISRPYAPLVTCENLFDAKSKLDPSVLFNMIPDLDKKFDDMLDDFRIDTVQQYRLLLSSGNGTEEFMKGVFKFFETLGFNMEKAKPLLKPMAKWFGVSLGLDTNNPQHLRNLDSPSKELLDALGKLDTKDVNIALNLYGFFENFNSRYYIYESLRSIPAPIVENLPGLIKSAIPKSWEPEKWYDTIFQLLGDVKINSPKKSTSKAIATIKSAVKIPEKYGQYVNNIFDTAPELVQQMVNGKYTYAGTWAAELVKLESSVNPVTTRLSNSIFKFIGVLQTGGEEIPAYIETLITFAPGLAYRYYPEEAKNIDRCYNTLSESFESFDFAKLNSTLQKTKMSDFIINFVDKLIQTAPEIDSNGTMFSKSIRDLFIINFSRTFYRLVTSKYEDQLDTFFNTLIEGFKHFPNSYDVGKIISDLVTNLGGTVPKEIKPLLENTQDFVDIFTSFSRLRLGDPTGKLIEVAVKITKAYKVAFPESKYPDFVLRYREIMVWSAKNVPYREPVSVSECYEINYYTSLTWAQDRADCFKKVQDEHNLKLREYYKEFLKKTNDLSVDIQFALFDDFNELFNSMESALIDSFPAYGILVRLMKVLDPADVKDLLNEYTDWMMNSASNPSLFTVDNFIKAINVTVAKITAKLSDVTKELRKIFAPDFCKYLSCSDEFCNTPAAIDKVQRWTKPVEIDLDPENPVTSKNEVTTSGSVKLNASVFMNIGAMLLMLKSMW